MLAAHQAGRGRQTDPRTEAAGRYSFTATQPTGGTLRPPQDPDGAGLDDEDGAEG
ncbi:hypothetical protein [Streptomyces sp. NPDC050804]|uniref:hypothetical protein n=1 Tax=Streptomyces sp. NPDC050804 TaxID=3154745 RepID=UPI003432B444